MSARRDAVEWAPEAGSGLRPKLRSSYTRVRYVLERRSDALGTVRTTHVVVYGACAARNHHAAVTLAEDFDRSEWPSELVHEARYASVSDELAISLCPRLDPRTERVVQVHVQVFVESPRSG